MDNPFAPFFSRYDSLRNLCRDNAIALSAGRESGMHRDPLDVLVDVAYAVQNNPAAARQWQAICESLKRS